MATFGKAFKSARASGQKTFEWNGKKYTTELKEEQTARLKTGKPYEGPKAKESIKMRTAAEEAADDAKIAASMKEPKKEKKESEAITPLPPLKKPESKPRTRVETKAEVRKAPSFGETTATTQKYIDELNRRDAQRWGGEPKTKETPKPNVWSNPRGGGGMGGSLDPSGTSSPKGLRREPKFASGGKVGSASKRGDGCAIRGKTRGVMR